MPRHGRILPGSLRWNPNPATPAKHHDDLLGDPCVTLRALCADPAQEPLKHGGQRHFGRCLEQLSPFVHPLSARLGDRTSNSVGVHDLSAPRYGLLGLLIRPDGSAVVAGGRTKTLLRRDAHPSSVQRSFESVSPLKGILLPSRVFVQR